MAELQSRRSGWGTAVLLLVVSLAVFVAAGATFWSWQYVLVLIPVLLIHEAGHYAAMRVFGYANVRMFFIPLFGAAVSGRSVNVPGWKKAVVSLMGPVPGIILGGALGIVGSILHEGALIRTGLLVVLLNGFNLLPLLPLDGGWFAHAVLFVRHPFLDVGFRSLAALGLVALALRLGDIFLIFLSVLMLLGIPIAYRQARVTQTLRERGVVVVSPDGRSLPAETAGMIVDELERATPRQVATRLLARQALEIFESLNVRPPGWAASLALVAAYLASGFMALLFLLVLGLALRAQ